MSAPEPFTVNVPEETVELPGSAGPPTSASDDRASEEASGVAVAVGVRVGVPAMAVRVGVRVAVEAEVPVRVGVGVTER
jgi:hypothetical protein